MNREQGVSSLVMVLLLLILGSLMLQGMNQQQVSFTNRVAMESQSLQRQAVVQSAMEWGRVQSWQRQPAVQCRAYSSTAARVCLRVLSDDVLLLIAHYEGVSLWRLGDVVEGRLVFSPQGWSDFCPLNKDLLCQIP
ncbi:hypothetical protein CJP72_12560 [Citrobacter sp. NCU1]|uniref:DUF2509 family protein n=1 Tax=Citrobacter sp. NCU1 TaxID=2026683 RepID=UPI00139158F8|nr:DUF2509 family protein [Citrobacter sp. NCU1]NDO81567.1 hypothetical protein [Citrobacter sp. NCU1]